MVAGVVTVHDAERILCTMESVHPVTPLCALYYRAFQKQFLRAKASARLPKQVSICLQRPLHLLPAGFCLLGLLPIPLLQLGNWTPLLRFGQMLAWSMEVAIVLTVALFKGLRLLMIWLMILV